MIAFGVSSVLDDDGAGPSTDERRRNMFWLLEQDRKRKEAERVPAGGYTDCLKIHWTKRSGNKRIAVGKNTCNLTRRCGMAQNQERISRLLL